MRDSAVGGGAGSLGQPSPGSWFIHPCQPSSPSLPAGSYLLWRPPSSSSSSVIVFARWLNRTTIPEHRDVTSFLRQMCDRTEEQTDRRIDRRTSCFANHFHIKQLTIQTKWGTFEAELSTLKSNWTSCSSKWTFGCTNYTHWKKHETNFSVIKFHLPFLIYYFFAESVLRIWKPCLNVHNRNRLPIHPSSMSMCLSERWWKFYYHGVVYNPTALLKHFENVSSAVLDLINCMSTIN